MSQGTNFDQSEYFTSLLHTYAKIWAQVTFKGTLGDFHNFWQHWILPSPVHPYSLVLTNEGESAEFFPSRWQEIQKNYKFSFKI